MKRIRTLKANVTVKELSVLQIRGAARVHTTSLIKCEQLDLDVSGAANTDLQIEASLLIAEISGAASCEMAGNTKNLKLNISGAGNFNAVDLESETVDIEVSGAGSARVNTKDELKATVSGAGSVNYTGKPSVKEIEITGAGSVRSLK